MTPPASTTTMDVETVSAATDVDLLGLGFGVWGVDRERGPGSQRGA